MRVPAFLRRRRLVALPNGLVVQVEEDGTETVVGGTATAFSRAQDEIKRRRRGMTTMGPTTCPALYFCREHEKWIQVLPWEECPKRKVRFEGCAEENFGNCSRDPDRFEDPHLPLAFGVSQRRRKGHD